MSNNNYQVVLVNLSKIKPDKKQPRRIFEKEEIQNLANSIKRHGVIKNIEITSKYVIVTGENRYRAAKLAGLKQIPCRIIDLETPELRERQLAENLQHIEMNPMDVAEALFALKKRHGGISNRKMAAMLGKNLEFVDSHLQILHFPKALKADVSAGRIPTRSIRRVNPILRLEQEGVLRQGSVQRIFGKKGIVNKSRNLEVLVSHITSNPNFFEEYMAVDFEGKSSQDVYLALNRIDPTATDKASGGIRIQTEFLFNATKLNKYLRLFTKGSLGLREGEIVRELKETKRLVESWLA